jgi:hypothetical protein
MQRLAAVSQSSNKLCGCFHFSPRFSGKPIRSILSSRRGFDISCSQTPQQSDPAYLVDRRSLRFRFSFFACTFAFNSQPIDPTRTNAGRPLFTPSRQSRQHQRQDVVSRALKSNSNLPISLSHSLLALTVATTRPLNLKAVASGLSADVTRPTIYRYHRYPLKLIANNHTAIQDLRIKAIRYCTNFHLFEP